MDLVSFKAKENREKKKTSQIALRIVSLTFRTKISNT